MTRLLSSQLVRCCTAWLALTGLTLPAPVAAAAADSPGAVQLNLLPGMPPVPDARNLYSETTADHLGPLVKGQLERVYVPNLRSNDVYVIDPKTLKVVERFKVGSGPQHVVPAYDLQTLWVANNAERTHAGSLTPIDPKTAKPGTAIAVDDPYNMYFTPNGKSAIVVAEARRRLDFRDPHSMAAQFSIETPECGGINHADFALDGRYVLFTCEFDGSLVKIDLVTHKVLGYLKLKMPGSEAKQAGKMSAEGMGGMHGAGRGMPQDIRISPDGSRFFIADMDADGVHVVDGEALKEIGFIATGLGAHGLYPSRDGKLLYVSNRGTHRIHGARHGPGSVSVISFADNKVIANWPIPGGGSPDMGNVSVDGKALWLSGRFDDVVYRFDTGSGAVVEIPVGQEPHGLTVWPQPGRYSLGHTGNMR